MKKKLKKGARYIIVNYLKNLLTVSIMLHIHQSGYEEGVRKAYHNAVDFIESAKILKDQHKPNASTALAIHALEELGKSIKLIDEIDRETDKITEERWNEKYSEHYPKLMAANREYHKKIGYKSLEGDGKKMRVKAEGDAAREFTDFDVEQKERSYYVDYDFKGGKGWMTPLERDTLVTPDSWIYAASIVKTVVEEKCDQKEIIL